MNRAERIARRKRYKAKVIRVVGCWHSFWSKSKLDDPKAIGKYVNHGLQVCSCYACGNRRATEGKTMQERRADEVQNDFLQG